jgi:hypothetical protein
VAPVNGQLLGSMSGHRQACSLAATPYDLPRVRFSSLTSGGVVDRDLWQLVAPWVLEWS